MNVELSDNYIKLMLIKKKRRKIFITKYIREDIKLDFIYKDYSKINSKEGKNSINLYINTVTKFIKSEIKEVNKKYKEINFNMQNNNIIVRNIKVLNVNNKKDIDAMIKFEITQYLPININDYIVKHKVLNSTEKEIELQVILVPKYMIFICREISNMLNMKPKNLCINFDILQKIISLGLVKDYKDNAVFIENKDNEFILNKVKDKSILETYILPKTHQSYQSVNRLIDEYKQIYYYGLEDLNIFNQYENSENLKKLEINQNIKISVDNKYNSNENIEYINCIGMVI